MTKLALLQTSIRHVVAALSTASCIVSCGAQSDDATETLPGGPLVIGQAPKVTCSVVPCAKQIAAGNNHACARFENGLVACWGSNVVNESGQSLVATTSTDVPLTHNVSGIQNVTSITAAGQSSCAVIAGGYGFCWGNILTRFNPPSSSTTEYLPAQVSGQLAQIVINKGSDEFLCVTRLDGTVDCLGSNSNGQLGNGSTSGTVNSDFVHVEGLATVQLLGTGYTHACALTGVPARLFCWGDNMFGAVGPPFLGLAGQASNGTQSLIDNVAVPREVSGLDNSVAVTGTQASSRTCVLDKNGIARCWGQEIVPSTGRPVTIWSPERRLDAGGLLVSILGTEGGLCGVTSKGHIVCENSGETSNIADVVQAACGQHFCCALRSNGQIQCRSNNDHGQLGIGSVDDTWHDTETPDFSLVLSGG